MRSSKRDEAESQVVPSKAGLAQVASAVFFSFFGVRRKRDHEADAVRITPLQVMVGGIIGAALLLAGLLLLVSVVTRHAG